MIVGNEIVFDMMIIFYVQKMNDEKCIYVFDFTSLSTFILGIKDRILYCYLPYSKKSSLFSPTRQIYFRNSWKTWKLYLWSDISFSFRRFQDLDIGRKLWVSVSRIIYCRKYWFLGYRIYWLKPETNWGGSCGKELKSRLGRVEV